MPTPRRSGAPLAEIPLTVPAFKGLNKQSETSLLGPEWATLALNATFDVGGRLSARMGWENVTSTPMSGTPVIEHIHEQIALDGTTTIISAANSKLWSGTSVPTDITGTATVTVGNNWQFINFAGNVYGVQQGELPIVRSTGNFSDTTVASGSAPQGNCGVSHSGRLWIVDSDKQTIKYCALLDSTNWATGAGNIDMRSVWPEGTDEIVALAMYNRRMVVFGKNRIVFFSDDQGGAPLGLNPSTIQVSDTIVGVGCIARDSVQQIENGDILFLSAQGVQSLSRLIQEKSNPILNVSKNVRDYLLGLLAGETLSKVRSIYSPENAFYLLSFPTQKQVFCFDTTGRLEDGSLRVTEWNTGLRALARALDGTLYLSLASGAGGKIGKYSGFSDNGVVYNLDYASAWLDLGEDYSQYIKIIKSITGILYISSVADVLLKWDVDFQGSFDSRSLHLTAPGTAEWNIMEWGIGEWSGGLALRNISAPAAGQGQYIRVGLQTQVSGATAIQQIKLFTKIGRLAK